MRIRNIAIVAFIISGAILFQSHSDGRATRGRDNTGAPGGQMGGGGNTISCNNCHSNANFEVGLSMDLIDAENNIVTEYIPNEVYTARVTIETLSGSPTGYGFQMVSLLESNDADVNGWIDGMHSNNVQLTTIDNLNRRYAEHNDLSSSNEFSAQWTAPAASSGDITFYVAGIGANSNNGSGGDHAPETIQVSFSESATTSTTSAEEDFAVTIYPNPVIDQLQISGELPSSYRIYSSRGHMLLSQSFTDDTANFYSVDVTDFNAGVYFIIMESDKGKRVERFVKL